MASEDARTISRLDSAGGTNVNRSNNTSTGGQSGTPRADSADYHSIHSPATLLPAAASAPTLTTGVVMSSYPALTGGAPSPGSTSAVHPTVSNGELGRFSVTASSPPQQLVANCSRQSSTLIGFSPSPTQRQQEAASTRPSAQVRDNAATTPTASHHLRPEPTSRLSRADGNVAAAATVTAASQRSSPFPPCRSHTEAEEVRSPPCVLHSRPFFFQPVRTAESVCVATTASSSEWVVLNVGGRLITTTVGTLMADPDSVLASLCAYLSPPSDRGGTVVGKRSGAHLSGGSFTHQETSGRCGAVSGMSHPADEAPIGGIWGDLRGRDNLSHTADLADSRDASGVRNNAFESGGVDAQTLPTVKGRVVEVSQAAEVAPRPTPRHVDNSVQRDGDCFSPFSDPCTTNRPVHHSTTAPNLSTSTSPSLPQSLSQQPTPLFVRRELRPTYAAAHTQSPVTLPLGSGLGEEGDGEAVNPQQIVSAIPLDTDGVNAILLDLDADYFLPVLNYLRHGAAMIPPYLDVDGVLAMAEYLNVMGLVRLLRAPPVPRHVMLFSWGSGSNGELGTHSMRDEPTPTMAQVAPFGVRVQDIVLGANYTCVLSDTGSVYTFGNGEWGQLGLGGSGYAVRGGSGGGGEGGGNGAGPDGIDVSVDMLIPRRIPLFERLPAVHVAAGYAFAMAIVEGHHVYFWGNNNHGQSGRGRSYFDLPTKKVESPVLVETLEGRKIVQLSCGSFFALALSEDGSLYSWGLVDCVGLGTPEEVELRYHDVLGESLSNERRTVVLTPQLVTVKGRRPVGSSGGALVVSERIVCVRAGQWHSGAISEHGELFTWGVGYQGRLGQGSKAPAYVPTLVRGALEGHRVVDVACGSFHTVALTTTGCVFCWGDNASGQCGTTAGSPDAFTAPYRVVGLEFVAGGVARSVACGRQHTVVVMEGPQPWCQKPCCRVDVGDGMCFSHAQAYCFGESARTASASGSTITTTTATAVGSATRGTVASSHLGISARAMSAGTLPPAPSPSSLRVAGDTMPFSLPSTEGHHHPHYRLVPDLQAFDVRVVVSGLHHAFACVEELSADTPQGTSSVSEEGFTVTRGRAHRLSYMHNPDALLPPRTAWEAGGYAEPATFGSGLRSSTSGEADPTLNLTRRSVFPTPATERSPTMHMNALTGGPYDSLRQDMLSHHEMLRRNRQPQRTTLRARFLSGLQMNMASGCLPFSVRGGSIGGRRNATHSRSRRSGGGGSGYC
ncbi:hypothetical protein JKF63_05410 [Porcisia hertigi]|uniref:BTB domain-containing protein n=1 Tax=Porcisia hertigi TaxID=2761500 RepID=A0A836IBD4_9TRYP|nr:hypothetical protein JKF63_05410 [Porcisia hertigi]